MPKRDDDLFERLRRAGVRKQVAKTLSELGEDAGKKAVSAGHRAVAELRVLADEIEKRLPAQKSVSTTQTEPTPIAAPRRRATPPATRTRAPKAPATRAGAKAPTPRTRTTTARPAASATASRGENKAKILAALKSGPQTASEVSQKTGIATPTVSTALTRLAKSGEVTKASRGYGLPQ